MYRNVQGVLDSDTKTITRLLDERESVWTNQQRMVLREEIKKKLQKSIDFNIMVKNLLNGCKTWGGPVTSTSELLEILQKNPDAAEKILRTKFAYFVHMHLTEKPQQPDLFRQNSISYGDKLGNFCILLSDNLENCSATIANLPNNDDGVRAIALLTSCESEPPSISAAYKENDMCVIFWKESNQYVWYLGYISELINGGEYYKVEHLHHFLPSQHKYWQ